MSIGSARSEIYIIFYSEGGERGRGKKRAKSNKYIEIKKDPPPSPPQSHTFTSKHAESWAALESSQPRKDQRDGDLVHVRCCSKEKGGGKKKKSSGKNLIKKCLTHPFPESDNLHSAAPFVCRLIICRAREDPSVFPRQPRSAAGGSGRRTMSHFAARLWAARAAGEAGRRLLGPASFPTTCRRRASPSCRCPFPLQLGL